MEANEKDKQNNQSLSIEVSDTLNNNDAVWEENHQMIEDCRIELIKKGENPTISNIAKQTGLSKPTVSKHIKFDEEENYDHTISAIMKSVAPAFLRQICQGALNGNYKDKKLLMQYLNRSQTRNNKTASFQVNKLVEVLTLKINNAK